jgi:hypothetical protein
MRRHKYGRTGATESIEEKGFSHIENRTLRTWVLKVKRCEFLQCAHRKAEAMPPSDVTVLVLEARVQVDL